jgi:Flp pilus assembly protein TadG
MKVLMPVKIRVTRQSPRRGVAAAEFALLLPPLMILMVGTIDFARVFYYYVTVSNCARNGALWASDPYSNPDFGIVTTTTTWSPYTTVTQAAQADATGSGVTFNTSPADVVITYPAGGATMNGNVTVTVSHSFSLLSSYLLGTNSVTLARSVTMLASETLPN